ncbi:nitrate- and nitrite sensing domain-containing protein [Micromonospora krabiensis]|uniref:histidine kinase n=1 Tax=Micromonospora krabiensis TaxID=307121 RepID=A0A1C3N9S0_9ACTN|nr:nitrate- and nitrite sensing domain-containing protein [Micromonospora krabiensis]SBV29309.1 Signal transduction histidine kinase [Micromonospora krabiensis]
MLLGRLRIRGKLALLVVIPLVSMVGLAVPVVLDRVAVAQRAGDIADRVRLASRIGTLVQDLQQERILSVGLLLGTVTRAELMRRSATVDDRVADLRAERGDRLEPLVADALEGVRALTDVRAAVLAGAAGPQQVLDAYGPVNRALIDSLRLAFDVDTDTAAGRQVLALDSLLRADEGLGLCATLIVLVKVSDDPAVTAGFVATMAALRVDSQRFRSLITPEQRKLAELNDAAVTARTSADFLSTGAVDPAGAVRNVPLEMVFPSARSMVTLGQFIEKKMVADVLAEATGEQRRALTTAYLVAGLAALILAVVVLLSAVVARTVARPLTRLTRSADRVARVAEAELVRVADDEAESAPPVRLDPVDVRARDEIGDLARAFERVQATAARLVERQVAGRRNVAQMFGHVGRRTQNLVGRQIALIDRLEQRETDAGRLADLYRLDHISSRLRRNAGSLVVLSGSPGTDAYVAPVPLADVVRLALGEIEDYTRVDVRVPAEIAAAPATVGDLVLALAELMENATVFSPPHTRVVVSAEPTEAGARLTVTDHGIGMTRERLAEENARLTRRERLDLAPTEVLGLFVVGRLARRHGWAVNLAPTGGGGVTARLEVPRASLVFRPTERAGAAIARATVPVRERRSPALTGGTPDGPAALGGSYDPPAFDPTSLGRASRSMATGETWDAFGAGAEPEPAAGGGVAYLEISPPDGDVAPPETVPADRSPASPEPTATVAGRAAVPGPTATPPAGVTSAGLPRRPSRPAADGGAPATTGGGPDRTASARVGPGVRQRVPGSQLPPSGPTAGPVDGTGADPAAARALVEAIESGVRRAERLQPLGPADVPPRPAGGPASGVSPHPGRPALNRRVPGASLDGEPARRPVSPHPGDPAEVRDLITEFEAGVARALREVSPDRRNEEGSTR